MQYTTGRQPGRLSIDGVESGPSQDPSPLQTDTAHNVTHCPEQTRLAVYLWTRGGFAGPASRTLLKFDSATGEHGLVSVAWPSGSSGSVPTAIVYNCPQLPKIALLVHSVPDVACTVDESVPPGPGFFVLVASAGVAGARGPSSTGHRRTPAVHLACDPRKLVEV